MAHQSDGPALSLGRLGMGTEQCAAVDVNSKKRGAGGGGGGELGVAHQSDGAALSLGRWGMGTEQCAVVDVNSKCWKSVFLWIPGR